MMNDELKILAIESSGEWGSVAVGLGGQCCAQLALPERRQHSRSLMTYIPQVIKQAGWTVDDIDVFAVSIGPGSFTGIRVGVTAAKSLAYALKKKVLAIDSLQAAAHAARRHDAGNATYYCPVVDAAQSEYYYAIYDQDLKIKTEPQVIAIADFEALSLPQGTCVLKDIGKSADEASANKGAQACDVLALAFLQLDQASEDTHGLNPRYLKASAPERKLANAK